MRTSWVCGVPRRQHGEDDPAAGGASTTSWRFVDDQRGHPTFTADLRRMIRRLVVDRRPGVFHVTNQGAV